MTSSATLSSAQAACRRSGVGREHGPQRAHAGADRRLRGAGDDRAGDQRRRAGACRGAARRPPSPRRRSRAPTRRTSVWPVRSTSRASAGLEKPDRERVGGGDDPAARERAGQSCVLQDQQQPERAHRQPRDARGSRTAGARPAGGARRPCRPRYRGQSSARSSANAPAAPAKASTAGRSQPPSSASRAAPGAQPEERAAPAPTPSSSGPRSIWPAIPTAASETRRRPRTRARSSRAAPGPAVGVGEPEVGAADRADRPGHAGGEAGRDLERRRGRARAAERARGGREQQQRARRRGDAAPTTVSTQAPSTVPGTRPARHPHEPAAVERAPLGDAWTSTIGVATVSGVTGIASGATSSSAGTTTSA